MRILVITDRRRNIRSVAVPSSDLGTDVFMEPDGDEVVYEVEIDDPSLRPEAFVGRASPEENERAFTALRSLL